MVNKTELDSILSSQSQITTVFGQLSSCLIFVPFLLLLLSLYFELLIYHIAILCLSEHLSEVHLQVLQG